MKNTNVSRRSIRTIPDVLFEELWFAANNSNTEEEYLSKILDKNSKINKVYLKHKIPLIHFMDMLNYIYILSKKAFKEIVESSGLKSSHFRHYYCIPENTYKAWYYGKNPCPAHFRLLLIKSLGLFKLPHHIYIESEEPRLYNITKEQKKSIDTEINAEEEYKFDKAKYDTIKEWEKEHLKEDSGVKELLEKLNYLDDIIQ